MFPYTFETQCCLLSSDGREGYCFTSNHEQNNCIPYFHTNCHKTRNLNLKNLLEIKNKQKIILFTKILNSLKLIYTYV